MAASATVSVTGTFGGLPGGSRTIGPISATSAAASGQVTEIVLASGDNTITVPTTPVVTGCIIVLPSTNTQLTKLKNTGSDSGLNIGMTSFAVLTWNSANIPASFILNSAAAQTGLVTEIIFF